LYFLLLVTNFLLEQHLLEQYLLEQNLLEQFWLEQLCVEMNDTNNVQLWFELQKTSILNYQYRKTEYNETRLK
jgi:hypothetical protein